MKKILITLVLLLTIVITTYAQSSKVVYSNALTHFFLTCVDNDTARVYIVSETSVPAKNAWRISDQYETQVLKVFPESDIEKFLKETLAFAENAKLDDEVKILGITVSYKKIYGISCIQFTNPRTNVQFNCNKRTIRKAIEALDEYIKTVSDK